MLSKQRISNIVEKWYLLEPFFFIIWTTHELSINPNLQTIRVGQGKIEYNPTFIETLDDKTLYQVMQFEVMRIILKHPYLRRKENAAVAYLASNITIQEYLNTSLPFPRAKDFFPQEQFEQKYFEFYYHQLLKLLDESSSSSPSNQGSASGSGSSEESNSPGGGKGTPTAGDNESGTSNAEAPEKEEEEEQEMSDPSGGGGETEKTDLGGYTDPEQTGAENTETWDANEYYANQINEKIEDVQQGNLWGTVPYRLQELILATLKPKINYRDVLKSFRASILSVKRILTRMRPSRRYEFLYMGSRRDFCTKLLFAVDVSGSVSSADLRNAFSIVNRFFKYGIEQIDVIQFDTVIKDQPLVMKKARPKIGVIGRGGTDFQAVMDYIDQERDYDGLIIFTDGYAPVPQPPKNKRTRILWLFNNERNCVNMEKLIKPIGRATFIKES